jgi:hypothetical protein
MGGTSDQEKAAKEQLNQQRKFQRDLSSGKFNVANPFANYESQFGYDEISKNINDIFGGQADIINRDSANAVAEAQGDATASLASRGITGGSAVDTVKSGIASDVNKSKTNALAQLGIGKAGSMTDLMKYINQLDFSKLGAGANIGLANMGNKLGGLQSSFGTQASSLRGLDDTTWLDDALGIVKTGAAAAGEIAKIPGI